VKAVERLLVDLSHAWALQTRPTLKMITAGVLSETVADGSARLGHGRERTAESRSAAPHSSCARTTIAATRRRSSCRAGSSDWAPVGARSASAPAEGKAEGKAEGVLEGVLEGQRETLRHQLRLKFQAAATDAVLAQLDDADARTLARWEERILTATTIEEALG
jgi:hypothetical protein